jgi:hypothetical protein
VLNQAVRAVSENRPKYPMLDIPFRLFGLYDRVRTFLNICGGIYMYHIGWAERLEWLGQRQETLELWYLCYYAM